MLKKSRIFLFTAFAVLGFGLVLAPLSFAKEAPKAEQEQQNILIKVSHFTDDLHSPTMALKLAELFARKGAKVTMFLNLEAARIADKGANLDLRWGQSPSIQLLMEKAEKAGVAMLVCPHCAKAAGMKKSDLRKGAMLGNEESLADAFLKADKVIDY